MSDITSTTNQANDMHCKLEKGHDDDHNFGFPLHKCTGENCSWCIPDADKCNWKFITFQAWVLLEVQTE